MNYIDADQPPQQLPHVPHHRVKSQKYIVGGGTGGRLHARVPSSKGLKHHATTSTAKLNRRHGSLSPDRGTGLAAAAHHHRRATSDLKLARDPSSTNLKKDPSHTNLRRNRSQVDAGKRTKSTTSLHRSASNPAVDKLRSSASSRVHFNLGDDDQDDDPDDEWVDASTSASPLLSRRGSAVVTQPPVDDENPRAPSPTLRREDTVADGTRNGSQNGTHSLSRDPSNHSQYLTSRILSRTSLQGAPPKMSAENVSVRPSSRQQSPLDSSLGNGASLSGTPGAALQARPGSSGKAELTSRFVGNNSQEPGSGIPGESFMLAANRGGLSRAALNGLPRRRQSMGSLSRRLDAMDGRHDDNLTDEEDVDQVVPASRTRRGGDYVVPRDLNRTQQKLNLQRASSSLEPAHPHPGIAGVAAGAGPLIGVPTYDSEDRRIAKLLERTGMEYLTVRRHVSPVARSISRVMQLPGVDGNRQIPQPSGRGLHSARVSELGGGGRFDLGPNRREAHTRDPNMVDLMDTQATRRPPTPRRAFSAMTLASASSSPGTDDGTASRLHERQGQGLSGASLVDGTEDAGTLALLRMMWEKNMDLSASQD
ncbi:putative transport protein MmpL8 [Madurella mycetomatis]|uniref:Transport protein MmpL8 n=1 Tax=Madurella mycetomatis TaxID=100816 RepID=A0A175VVX7_9PEZI|nr:putative transport protein MmpL8 [Madurella mycetomatis]